MSSSFEDLFPHRFAVHGPDGIPLPAVVALGGEVDNTICILSGHEARVSSRLGDLGEPDTLRYVENLVRQLPQGPGFGSPSAAHDLHPHYFSSGIARRLGWPTAAVQHHHAHVASVAAENSTASPVVGIACDGAGFGSDGAVWGCEIIRNEGASFRRLAHLEYFPLLGGDAAALENWRPAAAMLRLSFGTSWAEHWPSGRMRPDLRFVEHFCDWPTTSHLTSSLGRVFDGLAFLLGLCERNDRRARAAQALEAAAASEPAIVRPYESVLDESGRESILRIEPMVRGVVSAIKSGEAIGTIAARCHETIAGLLARAAIGAIDRCGGDTVALSGGCFVNERLRRRVVDQLHAARLRVNLPRQLPFGDAGLSLGQAIVAAQITIGCASQSDTATDSSRLDHVSGGACKNC